MTKTNFIKAVDGVTRGADWVILLGATFMIGIKLFAGDFAAGVPWMALAWAQMRLLDKP